MLLRLKRLLSSNSVDGRIARAALLSGGLSAGVKGASFAKEVLVAAYFGVSGQLDAYLVALMLVGVPHGIVVNAIQWSLIPEFVRAQASGGQTRSRALLRQAVAIALLSLAGLLAVWAALLPVLAGYLTRQAEALASDTVRTCFKILCIYYFTSGTLLLGYATLQARKQFLINGAVPLITPITIAVLLVAVPVRTAETLAWGMAVGFAVELIIVERALRAQGLTLVPASPFGAAIDRSLLASMGRFSIGATALAMMPFVEQAAAIQFGIGAVSTLGYANKLPALLGGLAVTAIAVAALPHFSELLAKGQAAVCRQTLRRYVAIVSAGGAAIALTLILLSDAIVRLLFQRGAFDEAAAAAVTVAQQAYLLQIPGALVLALASRALLACRCSGAMTVVHLSQLALLVIAVQIAVRSFDTPAAVALAYSVVLTLASYVAYRLASRALALNADSSK